MGSLQLGVIRLNYEKQTFINGQILSAEILNRMESGIKSACDAAPPECTDTDCSKVLSHGPNGCEWVDRYDGVTANKEYVDNKIATFFSERNTVLTENQYGDDLPAVGTAGRIFFVKYDSGKEPTITYENGNGVNY